MRYLDPLAVIKFQLYLGDFFYSLHCLNAHITVPLPMLNVDAKEVASTD